MPQICVGYIIQTPMVQETNGGKDKCPCVVTAVGGDGPNTGVLVNVTRFWNDSGGTVDHVEGLECVDYETDARNVGLGLGVGLGGWPMDWS